MRLKIEPIEKHEFIQLLSSAPAADKKWVTPLFHNLRSLPKYYKVKNGVTHEVIGLTYCLHIDGFLDFSLIIFPNFQRQGFGKYLINHIHHRFENVCFTVSKSNISMISLFAKISQNCKIEVTTLNLNRFQFKLN